MQEPKTEVLLLFDLEIEKTCKRNMAERKQTMT